MTAFERIAILNRGEPAVRFLRALRDYNATRGTEMVAVALYTEPDRATPFTRMADEAVPLGPALRPQPDGRVISAYTDRALLLDTLAVARVDAVWPGWGFVAEDAAFVEALEARDITFIGPSSQAMRRLGDKIAAKRLAEEAGVPMAPWRIIDPAGDIGTHQRLAAEVGYPLVVKASAGGGGRGIRVVHHPDELEGAIAAVTSEVTRSFGAGGIFIEACVRAARHIEVQLVVGADGVGHSLGIRDCSIQRRHQKVIEEAPSPVVRGALAASLESAAVRLGEAVGYRGVGTVEFLVDPKRDFAHFLEVNTRLQVEHTITEAVTGVDLVFTQLDIAHGLPWERPDAAERGHAIEVRLNAEDPERNFQPSPGIVRVFRPPMGPGIRVDSGIGEGAAIAPEFDSMVAKLIAWGPDRARAIARLGRALRELELVIEDGASNKAFLGQLLGAEPFLSGAADTGWLDRRQDVASHTQPPGAFVALSAAALLIRQRADEAAIQAFFEDVKTGVPRRFGPAPDEPIALSLRGQAFHLRVWIVAPGRALVALDPAYGVLYPLAFEHHDDRTLSLTLGDDDHTILHSAGARGIALEVDGQAHLVEPAQDGAVTAPAPALVVSVDVVEGQRVEVGDRLGTLEAMKMELPVVARSAGVVRAIRCRPNLQVPAGEVLLVIEQSDDQSSGDTGGELVLPAPFDAGLTPANALATTEAALSGWDLPDPILRRLEGVLAAAPDDVPADWAPVADRLAVFVEVGLLFDRALPAFDGGSEPVRSEQAFYEVCRTLFADTPHVHPELRPALEAALARHGVIELTADRRATARALWRLARAHRAAETRHTVARHLLRLIPAVYGPGARDDGRLQPPRSLRLVLSQLVEVADRDHAGVRDLGQEARYQLFRRATAAPESSPGLGALLASDGHDASVCHAIMTRVYGEDCIVEALVEPSSVGPAVYRVVGSTGTLASAIFVPSDVVVEAAIGAVLRQSEADASEAHVYVFASPSGQPNLGAALVAARRRWAQVTLSWTEDGSTVQHATYRRDKENVARVDDQIGLHPEDARRLELWRLSGFELERLDAPAPLLVLRARAKANPRDERLIAFAELERAPAFDARGRVASGDPDQRVLEAVFAECVTKLREAQAARSRRQRYFLNRVVLHVREPMHASPEALRAAARRLEGPTRGLGIQKVVVQARVWRQDKLVRRIFSFAKRGRYRLEVHEALPSCAPIRAASDYYLCVERARRMGAIYPYDIVRALQGTHGAEVALTPHPDMAHGRFIELDLDRSGDRLTPVTRPFGRNGAGVVVGLISHATRKHPEGMTRVWIASDPTRAMGALAEPECRRIIAALDLAAERRIPVEWLPISAGARIAMDSGTENLDWTARVLARIVRFTQCGGAINVIVAGVNVGAQSYWNAEATMLMHTRGVLIQTADGSMVLTGKRALEVSGGVSAEDERGIGGFDRITGPNGQAQFLARDLGDAYRILFEHYAHTYVAPGEHGPRRAVTTDPTDRSVLDEPYHPVNGEPFRRIGEIFDDALNPGRKKPFAIREVMRALGDRDASHLERFGAIEGGETAVVWDAHLGGHPVCLIGFESRPVARRGQRPQDGPDGWTGGTLFPHSSKKVARALNQASGNRPAVVLANLSGFDGSPESMRRLQLEYGAEIGRAVVNFDGPIIFVVIARYHGGAYVVFSKALNPQLTALAVSGSYASVIGGAPAASVVFPREVRRRAAADPRITALDRAIDAATDSERPRLAAERASLLSDLILEYQGIVAREFDGIHTVERAVAVGSLDAVIDPAALRSRVISELDQRSALTWATADEARPTALQP